MRQPRSQAARDVVRLLIIEAIDRLVEALASFGTRVGRSVELTVGDDGMLAVMVSEFETVDEPTGYEQAAICSDVKGLLAYLETGEL
jgi:hypothetical protein